jgi:hypothetical protein
MVRSPKHHATLPVSLKIHQSSRMVRPQTHHAWQFLPKISMYGMATKTSYNAAGLTLKFITHGKTTNTSCMAHRRWINGPSCKAIKQHAFAWLHTVCSTIRHTNLQPTTSCMAQLRTSYMVGTVLSCHTPATHATLPRCAATHTHSTISATETEQPTHQLHLQLPLAVHPVWHNIRHHTRHFR